MSASILLQGKLERAPETRTSRNGNSFTTTSLRVSAGSELQFWRLFVFSEIRAGRTRTTRRRRRSRCAGNAEI